ncbi:TolC family protein [Lachnospiraceae bacterium 54-53]
MNLKYRKRLLLLLSFFIFTTDSVKAFASPSFAYSEEEWERLRNNTMEYDELTGLVHEYNGTVLNNQLDLTKKRDDPTADDVAQVYRDAADDLRGTITGDSDLADAIAEAQARQLELNADNNVFDLEVYRLTYDQTERNLVMMAQADMIDHQQALVRLEIQKQNRELQKELLCVKESQEQIGVAASIDVLSAKKDLQNTEAGITETEASVQRLRQTLCVMLGWDYDASPDIKEIPETDKSRIDNMNPDLDVEKAVANNYSLKINQRKFINAESEITKQTLQNTMIDNKKKIGASLQSQYQTVLQSEIAYEEAKINFELENRNMEIAEQKKQLGSISSLEYLQQQTNYLSKKAEVTITDLDLFQAMERYDWFVNGMAPVE